MIKNYILIALRNLKRNKLHASINIIGLAIGMACCVLIVLFVQFELNYDRQNRRADQVYRLVLNLEANNWAISAFPIGEILKENFPEIEAYTRIKPSEMYVSREESESKVKEKPFFADSSVFDVLDIKLLTGNPKQALVELNSMVLTPGKAKQFFGEEDPIGKTLTLSHDNQAYKITGIMEEVPSNSHFHPEILISSGNLEPMRPGSPNGFSYLTNHYTYLVLPKGIDTKEYSVKISEFMDTFQELTPEDPKNDLELQALTDIHLNSNRGLEIEPNGSIQTVYIMSAIAFFILVIACINFMNLTTAQSLKRAREVGIRKVAGGKRSQLIFQFLSESVLISFFSLSLAVLILTVIIPFFNELSGKEIEFNPIENGFVLPVFAIITFFVGVLAGTYPAFFLSNFKPVEVLKGNLVTNLRGQTLRKSLVVFQFAVAFVIMAGTFIIYRQLDFMMTKNMGFDREQVLVTLLPQDSIGVLTLKNEFMNVPGVESASRMLEIPGKMVRTTMFWHENIQDKKPENMYFFSGDEDLLNTLGMKMKAGDYFHPESQQFGKEFIINETAAKFFGWQNPEDAIGKLMDIGERSESPGKIVGVVEDFHFKHLEEKIDPLVMILNDQFEATFLAVKVKTENLEETIVGLENTWAKIAPDHTFEYLFLDETFDKLFDQDKRLGQLFGLFSGLAIFVSCLGLFGLASFSLEQSKKSVAVRKVLGASVGSIVVMMSKDFLKLVLVGLLIAAPIGWYSMNTWLSGFAYHIPFPWIVFLYVLLAGSFVALGTVSYHALRAATNNPVNSLKDL